MSACVRDFEYAQMIELAVCAVYVAHYNYSRNIPGAQFSNYAGNLCFERADGYCVIAVHGQIS